MAILETEVLVTLGNRNINYFDNLGYNIPRNKDIHGTNRVSRGTRILVKIEDLTDSCGVKVTKVCDECGKHIPNQKYGNVLNKRKIGDGMDRCFECGIIYARTQFKINVPFNRTLEYFAKENNLGFLLKEYSIKNSKKSDEIFYGTGDIYIWECSKCNSEFESSPNNRTSNDKGCPYCVGQKVNHTNCLWSTHPDVAKLLNNPEIGYKITYGRNKTEYFKCMDCGNIEQRMVWNVVNRGFSCSRCSDGISYPEKFLINLLDQINLKYIKQKCFEWANNLNGTKKIYDFYIPFLNCIIETHGEQHYNGNFSKLGGRSLKEEQENDLMKEILAKNNGIKYYIIIDCQISDLEYIKGNILKSKLSDLINLNMINWLECHEYACKSLVKKTCEIWNRGIKSPIEIGKILNLDVGTIRKYLKQGEILNWCDYNAEKNRKKVKKVIQLTTSGEYIKEWESVQIASKLLSIHPINIYKSCLGKNNKRKINFKWMYKEDYDKLQQNELTSCR